MEYKDWVKNRRVKWFPELQDILEGNEHLPEFISLEKKIISHLGSGSYYHGETTDYDGILSDEDYETLEKYSGEMERVLDLPFDLELQFGELVYEKFLENLGKGNEDQWLQWEGAKIDKTPIPYVLIYIITYGGPIGYSLMIRSTPEDVRQFKKILPNLFIWDRVEACMNEGTFDQVDAVDLAGYLRRQLQSESSEFPSSGGSPTGTEYEFTVKKGGKEFRIIIEGPMESPIE